MVIRTEQLFPVATSTNALILAFLIQLLLASYGRIPSI